MKPCLHCEGKGWVLAYNGPYDPPEQDMCDHCDSGLVFESEEERRLYEVLMT